MASRRSDATPSASRRVSLRHGAAASTPSPRAPLRLASRRQQRRVVSLCAARMALLARDSRGGRDCGSRDIICVASSKVSGMGRLFCCLPMKPAVQQHGLVVPR